MCDMHMLFKTGTVCLRVTETHFIFERICVLTLRTHMCLLLPAYLALTLNQVLRLFPIIIFTPLISGGDT